jgi:hypothetical protein
VADVVTHPCTSPVTSKATYIPLAETTAVAAELPAAGLVAYVTLLSENPATSGASDSVPAVYTRFTHTYIVAFDTCPLVVPLGRFNKSKRRYAVLVEFTARFDREPKFVLGNVLVTCASADTFATVARATPPPRRRKRGNARSRFIRPISKRISQGTLQE